MDYGQKCPIFFLDTAFPTQLQKESTKEKPLNPSSEIRIPPKLNPSPPPKPTR